MTAIRFQRLRIQMVWKPHGFQSPDAVLNLKRTTFLSRGVVRFQPFSSSTAVLDYREAECCWLLVQLAARKPVDTGRPVLQDAALKINSFLCIQAGWHMVDCRQVGNEQARRK